jgi:hypothetical protein
MLSVRKLAVAILIAASCLGGATVAFAHDSSATLYDRDGVKRGHGGVTASHYYVYACDDSADARRVFTEYKVHWSDTPYGWVEDVNGSAPGCNEIKTTWWMKEFRVCRDNTWTLKECTSWKGT